MPDERENPILIACAVHAEAGAVARGLDAELGEGVAYWSPVGVAPGFDVLVTGVGKANGAGGVARALATGRYREVWNLGVAGALPEGGLDLGDTILATRSLFADEGVGTPEGFASIASVGFPTSAGVREALLDGHDSFRSTAVIPRGFLDRLATSGLVATVSTGSGEDARALDVAKRTGAVAEAMEGAAIALVCAREGVPFAEVRSISNTTGDREAQVWDFPQALAALSDALSGVR